MDIMKIAAVSFGAIFINNFVFNRFLGFCPFFSASKNPGKAVIMGLTTTAVMTATCAVLYPLNYYILAPYNMNKIFQTAVFVFLNYLIILAIELIIKIFIP